MTETAAATDLAETVDTHLRAYCEPDVTERRRLVELVWSPDGALIDPPLDGTGHDGIVTMVEAVLALYPSHVFRRTTAIDAHHGVLRSSWELADPTGAVVVTGMDVADVDDQGAGPLLREWRSRRRMSQMELTHGAEVSPRHLYYVETGRSRPSRERLLTLAAHLDLPLRDRNSLLVAPGRGVGRVAPVARRRSSAQHLPGVAAPRRPGGDHRELRRVGPLPAHRAAPTRRDDR